MRYRFNEKDSCRIEAWARKTNLHAILTFIESKSPKLEFPRPVLIGSNGRRAVKVHGMGTRSFVCKLVRQLDEPFDPYTSITLTHELRKQTKDLSAEIYGTISKQLSKGSKELCFLEATGRCEHGIINAHLIQEALIRKIAVKGQVLQFNFFKRRDSEDGFRNWPEPVGVNKATTVTGFCSLHDNEVFGPIEKYSFTPTPTNLFLYAYRALCGRLYIAKYGFELVKATVNAVRASVPTGSNGIERTLAANDADVEEMGPIKAKWDAYLAAADFSNFDHLVLTCPNTPDILGTSFLAPPKNFDYSIAQTSKQKGPLAWVAMSIIPLRERGGLVLISSEKGNRVWSRFTASLLEQSPEKRTIALVNFMIPYFGEQLVLSPEWWAKVPPEIQESFVNTWSTGYYPRYLRSVCDWGPITPYVSSNVDQCPAFSPC